MSTFNQGIPGVPTLINSSQVLLTGNAASANALTVRQFGAGNVFSAQMTSGTTALFVGANGNVGIGTTGPQTALDVYTGTMNAATVSSTTLYGALAGSNTVSASAATFSATPAAAANVLTVIGSSTTGNVVQFSNTAGGTFIMTSTGRIGIGTTSPATALDVYTGTMNASTVSSTTLYGTLAGSNTVAASTVTATSLVGTMYGVLAGSNTVAASTVTATSVVGTMYGVLAGSNTVAASTVSATSLVGTMYGVLAGSNTVAASTVTATSNISGVTLNTTNLLIAGAAGTTNQVLQATGSGAGIQWGTVSALSGLTTGAVLYATSATTASTTGTAANFYWDNANARLGLGTASPGYPLHVSGTAVSAAAPYSNLAYQAGGWYQAYQPTTATTLKIYTDGKIGCTEVDVFSDRRIKSDIRDSDSSKDLDTILALRVREFRYKDPIEHGSATYTGLVAQEVKEVFPAAVSTHEGVIPDIFQVPTSFSGRVCQFTNKIEGLQIGARVKVLDESVEKILKIVRVSDFEIEFDSEIDGPKVFVYGQAVKDLHTVSYDRLVPVLISAVKALAAK
jgi:hypothetical protein